MSNDQGNPSGPTAGPSMTTPGAPPPPPGQVVYAAAPAPARGGGIGSRIIVGLIGTLLLLSITANFYLGSMVAVLTSSTHEATWEAGDANQRIVIIPVSGVINDSTAGFVRQSLSSIEENPPAAIVLRVDSPGGTVGASDRIWHMLKQFKDEHNTTIVASFGGVAASGGYYVSMQCDHIMAEPTSLTGSIGVVASGFTVDKLLDKVGVTPELIASSKSDKKTQGSPFEAWTPDDRAALRQRLDVIHNRFIEIVEEGREGKLTNGVEVWATGEVFTADNAKTEGLVDSVGYLEDAIEQAKTLASISGDPLVTIIRPPRPLIAIPGINSKANIELDPQFGEQLREQAIQATQPRLEYRWAPGM